MNSVKEAGADASVQMECLNEVTELMGETKKALDALIKVTNEAAAKEGRKSTGELLSFRCVPGYGSAQGAGR